MPGFRPTPPTVRQIEWLTNGTPQPVPFPNMLRAVTATVPVYFLRL
jgi:hypothetical protein